MKFFKKRDKKKNDLLSVPGSFDDFSDPRRSWSPYDIPSPASPRLLAILPPNVYERIFTFVCPHAMDRSYETCEQSVAEDACMLCDLRDLGHCAQVSRRWRAHAILVLYHSIRIDSVHYCDREIVLAERRKRRSFFDRNGEPEDPSRARLKLLCRTLRDDPTRLGALVRYFKTPYMLRESSQADLARTIAVLPHLRYVDLPEGLFADEPAFATLRLEVQARCPDLRKMTYMAGAERSLELLATTSVWQNLEVLELIKISMDPLVLRHVLGSLVQLRALKVTDSKTFSDDIFRNEEDLPPFPALAEFVLNRVPLVTSAGLHEYLSRSDARRALEVLTLWKTGVQPTQLQEVLSLATSLKTLALYDTVSSSIPSGAGVHRLASPSLETLRFEISPESTSSPFSGVTASYSAFLASSILAGGLPRLRAVYVRDPSFSDQLMGLPPIGTAPFAQPARPKSSSSSMGPQGSGFPQSFPAHGVGQRRPGLSSVPQSTRFSSNNPFAGTGMLTRTLEVFSKSGDNVDWSFVQVAPPAHFRSASGHGQKQQRPISSYGLRADVAGLGWNTGGARRSIMVGNGAGGFLAIPSAENAIAERDDDGWPRPKSSAGEERGDRDLWR